MQHENSVQCKPFNLDNFSVDVKILCFSLLVFIPICGLNHGILMYPIGKSILI